MPRLRLKMRDRLAEAIELAAAVDPRAELVRIFGLGLGADGTVEPRAPANWFCRWEYAFCNDHGGQAPPGFVSVSYLSADRPRVDPRAGNVSQTEPIDPDTLAALADSDRLAALFNDQSGFAPLSGQDGDSLILYMRRMLDPLAHLQNWRGQSLQLDPVGLRVLQRTPESDR